MDISCTVSRSCSRSHLSNDGLPPYVIIISYSFFSPTHHSTRPDHWQDVLVGSALGAVLGYFSYRQYFPSLVSKNSHRPYSPRVKREDIEMLPTHSLHTSGESHDDGNHNSHNDHHDDLAGTVPRPDTGHLENVWREGEDEVNATDDEVDVQPYNDSLQLRSKVSKSNDVP
jgi:hypothetical protein